MSMLENERNLQIRGKVQLIRRKEKTHELYVEAREKVMRVSE